MKKTNNLTLDLGIISDATDTRETIINRIDRYDVSSVTQDFVCNLFYQTVYASKRTKSEY